MPAIIMRILPKYTVSDQTPPMPPNMATINITNRINVREEVGNISEAIKLADEPAGEVKKNMTQITISNRNKSSINCDNINSIPEKPSKITIKLHVIKRSNFLPNLSKRGPTIKVLKKLDNDKGNIYNAICDWLKWKVFYRVPGNL